MNILFAASEAVPLVKTGGLADVVGSLPKALTRQGIQVRVVLPNYGEIPPEIKAQFRTLQTFTVQMGWRVQYCGLLEAVLDGIHFYLIDNEYYFKRGYLYGYEDEAERFVFFCLAVMESLRYMDLQPDILHCHDWQTGLMPFLLRTRYQYDPGWSKVQSVFTIHNLKYQGLFPIEAMKELLGIDQQWFTSEHLEFYGACSCIKAGLLFADKLTTVSSSYAQEIQSEAYGEGLQGVLRTREKDLLGIVNGIDVDSFHPMKDAALDVPYLDSLEDKRLNKLSLQRQLGLEVSESIPLIGLVSRLVEQKGLDLLERIMDELMTERLQLVVLGSGEYRYEEMLRRVMRKFPNRAAARFRFDDRLARRIYAASDIYLMPSRFEPCGLSQLIALQYRSVPLVRETGGLKDTVQPFNEYTGVGNGFSFLPYQAEDLIYTIRRALSFYANESHWETIVRGGTRVDYSWNSSAKRYIQLYRELLLHGKEKV